MRSKSRMEPSFKADLQTTGCRGQAQYDVTWRVLCSGSVLLAACGVSRAWTEVCMHDLYSTCKEVQDGSKLSCILHQLRSTVQTTNMCNLVLESTKVLLWRVLLKNWMHACWIWNVDYFSTSQNCIVWAGSNLSARLYNTQWGTVHMPYAAQCWTHAENAYAHVMLHAFCFMCTLDALLCLALVEATW